MHTSTGEETFCYVEVLDWFEKNLTKNHNMIGISGQLPNKERVTLFALDKLAKAISNKIRYGFQIHCRCKVDSVKGQKSKHYRIVHIRFGGLGPKLTKLYCNFVKSWWDDGWDMTHEQAMETINNLVRKTT